jgi:hypothetical protein
MSSEEIAEEIGVSISTVKSYWIFSKAWLYKYGDLRRSVTSSPQPSPP